MTPTAQPHLRLSPRSRSRCPYTARRFASLRVSERRPPSCEHGGVDDRLPLDGLEDDEGLTPTARRAVIEELGTMNELAAEFAATISAVDGGRVGIDDFLALRARLGVLFVALNQSSARITGQFGLTSAQDRMTNYLLQRIGQEVPKDELGGVSCIWEWARRARELDVEHGWRILVGKKEGISEGMYMLAADERDADRADLWRQKNRIRKLPGAAPLRILELLSARYPHPVANDDLDYVAKIRSRDRRTRDLQEAGWRIATHDTDPLLPLGWYRLDSLEIGPPRAREYLALREEILRDADFTCASCGYKRQPGASLRPLQVHHVRFLRDGGNDAPENLTVLCRPCHAGVHALDATSVDDELLNPDSDPLIT